MGQDCIVQKADELRTCFCVFVMFPSVSIKGNTFFFLRYVGAECFFTFGLFHPNGKLFFLCAENEKDREQWIEAINSVLL